MAEVTHDRPPAEHRASPGQKPRGTLGRRRITIAAGVALLALSGCSVGQDAGEQNPVSPGGGLDIAVSQTCAEASEPQCIQVNGEYVLVIPSDFARAGVDVATVESGNPTPVVLVRFDDDGAAVLRTASAEVASAGSDARLLLQVDDEIVAAVTVPEALDGNEVQIAPSSSISSERLVELIRSN